MKNLLKSPGAKVLGGKEQQTVKGGFAPCDCPHGPGCCYNGAWIPEGHPWYARYCGI